MLGEFTLKSIVSTAKPTIGETRSQMGAQAQRTSVREQRWAT